MKVNLTKSGAVLTPLDEKDFENLTTLSDGIYVIDINNLNTRTLQQNRALHLYCKQIADVLNSQAMYMQGVFGNDIEWSMDLVKTQIVKATIKQVFDISSTTKLKRKQIDQTIDFITAAFATKGVTIPPFPSRDLWEDKNV